MGIVSAVRVPGEKRARIRWEIDFDKKTAAGRVGRGNDLRYSAGKLRRAKRVDYRCRFAPDTDRMHIGFIEQRLEAIPADVLQRKKRSAH